MSPLPLYEPQYFGQEPIGTENDGDMPIVYVGRQNEEEPVRIENYDNLSINVHFRRPNEEVENMREIIVCVTCLNEESNVVLRPYWFAHWPLCREPIREIVVFLS
ncbi:unnamed protein product [Macrosiphum euphorbiae]|uniref:Tyrosine-protein phosphatase domain-containing protein n=1 Tax=Macrosiphum euphorbiae TaxID=13131 RepID=A0AAV0WJ18_9HEMI|nr:unnamed protein product [Macrosiphum euphorbiae]CAI6376714.1 unnamed protein product [Macrosiphum euphorbiae]